MLNLLSSEIEEILKITGQISIPSVVITIANVILLVVNVVIAIVKKIKNNKNTPYSPFVGGGAKTEDVSGLPLTTQKEGSAAIKESVMCTNMNEDKENVVTIIEEVEYVITATFPDGHSYDTRFRDLTGMFKDWSGLMPEVEPGKINAASKIIGLHNDGILTLFDAIKLVVVIFNVCNLKLTARKNAVKQITVTEEFDLTEELE